MKRKGQYVLPAFTLVEIFIVVMILAIIAAIAVPLYTSAASIQLKTAASLIASDIEYTKSMAISTGRNHSVVFDVSTESYRIKDDANNDVNHPVHIGAKYIVRFANDIRLSKVNIVSATFGAASTVTFNYLGSPSNGGNISLSAEDFTLAVKVEPVTGYVSIE